MLDRFRVPEEIVALMVDTAAQIGFELVHAVHNRHKGGTTIQAELAGQERGVTVRDCEQFTLFLEQKLQAAGLPEANGTIEVSSAGLEHTLRYRFEIEFYRGKGVLVQLRQAVENEYRFTGILRGLTAEDELIVDCRPGGGSEPRHGRRRGVVPAELAERRFPLAMVREVRLAADLGNKEIETSDAQSPQN